MLVLRQKTNVNGKSTAKASKGPDDGGAMGMPECAVEIRLGRSSDQRTHAQQPIASRASGLGMVICIMPIIEVVA